MANKSTNGQIIQIARGSLETRLAQKPLAYGELFINTSAKATTPKSTILDLVTNSNIKKLFPGDLFAGANSSEEVYAIGSGGALKWGGVLFETQTYADVVEKLKAYPNHIFMYNGSNPLLYDNSDIPNNATVNSFGQSQPSEVNKRYVASDSDEYNNKINPGDLVFYNPALDQVITLHLSHSTDALTKINVDALISDSMRNLLAEAETGEDSSNTNINRYKEASTLKTFLDGPVRHFQYLVDTSGWAPVGVSGAVINADDSTGKITVEPGIISEFSKDGDGYIHYVPFMGDNYQGLYKFSGENISGLEEDDEIREGDLIFSLPTDDGGITHTKLSLFSALLDMLRITTTPSRADTYATDIWATGVEGSYTGDNSYFVNNGSVQSFINRLFTTKVDIDPITHKIISSQIPDFLLGAPKYMGHIDISELEWEKVPTETTAENFIKNYLLQSDKSNIDWENLDANEDDTGGLAETNTIITSYYAYRQKDNTSVIYYTTDADPVSGAKLYTISDGTATVTDKTLTKNTITTIYYAYKNDDQTVTYYVTSDTPTTDSSVYTIDTATNTASLSSSAISAVDNDNNTITIDDVVYTKVTDTITIDYTIYSVDSNEFEYISGLDTTISTDVTTGNQHNVVTSAEVNEKIKTGCYWIYTGDTIDTISNYTNIFHLDETVDGEYKQTTLNKGDWIIYNGDNKLFEIIDNTGNFIGLLVDSTKVSGLVNLLHPKRAESTIQDWSTGEVKSITAEAEETHLEADSTSITITNPDTVVFKDTNTVLTDENYLPIINNLGYAFTSRYKLTNDQTGLQVNWSDNTTDTTNISSAKLLWHLDETSLTDADKTITWTDNYWKNLDSTTYVAEDVNTNRIYSNTEDGFNFQWMKFMGNEDTTKTYTDYSFTISLETNPILSLPQYSGTLTTEKYVNTGFTVIKAMMNDMYDKLLDTTTKGHADWLQTVRLSDEIDPRTGENKNRKEIYDSKLKQTFTDQTSLFVDLYYGEEKTDKDAVNTSTLFSRLSVYSTITDTKAQSLDATTDFELGEGTNKKVFNPSTRSSDTTVENVLPNHSGVLLNNNSVIDGGEW